jgi:Zn-finger nucleic acid-binding protein
VSHPYRQSLARPPCPRCNEGLVEERLHDVVALDCPACLGFFLDRRTIDQLGAPDGRPLRLAFPRRERRPEPSVRYLSCPICARQMNRVNFARVSGVIVDVCKDDGIWFDSGEINAIIEFVETGGLERARARAELEHEAENARLRSEYQRVHAEAVAAYSRHGGWRNDESAAWLGVQLAELLL